MDYLTVMMTILYAIIIMKSVFIVIYYVKYHTQTHICYNNTVSKQLKNIYRTQEIKVLITDRRNNNK